MTWPRETLVLPDLAFSLSDLAAQRQAEFAATIVPRPACTRLPRPLPVTDDGPWIERCPPHADATDEEGFPIPHPEEDDFDERFRCFDPWA